MSATTQTRSGPGGKILREFLFAEARKAPREFLIFRYGANRGTHIGQAPDDVYLDEAHGKQVIAEYMRRGIRLVIDYEHASVKGVATGAPAAGWGALELRKDGLWAVNVEWTERARTFLENREYRYFSPGFTTRLEQGKPWVTTVFHVALVNIPATDNQQPLVWAATQETRMEELLSALFAAMGDISDEQKAKIRAACEEPVKNMRVAWSAEPVVTPEAEFVAELRGLFGKQEISEIKGLVVAHKVSHESSLKERSAMPSADDREAAAILAKIPQGKQSEIKAICYGPDGKLKSTGLITLRTFASVLGAAPLTAPALNHVPSPANPESKLPARANEADQQMAKLFGFSADEIAAHRAKTGGN